VPHVWVVFSDAVRGMRGSRDCDFSTTCCGCELVLSLDQVLVDARDQWELVYRCPSCSAPVLIVSTPTVVPWVERGHVVGSWMIRNPRDLIVKPRGAGRGLVLPASPAALD
jgi:hypothetical protein